MLASGGLRRGLLRRLFFPFCCLLVLACAQFCPAGPARAASPDPADSPSLDRMLGSMLMLGFRGAELAPGDPFLAAVRSGNVGHVLLFDRDLPGGGERNIRSPEQLRRLTAVLRAAAPGPM